MLGRALPGPLTQGRALDVLLETRVKKGQIYGTPIPPLTMDEVQTAVLNKELDGEYTASAQSGMPTMGETEFIGKISGALDRHECG